MTTEERKTLVEVKKLLQKFLTTCWTANPDAAIEQAEELISDLLSQDKNKGIE